IFVGSGSSIWADADKHPYTIGWQPTGQTQARVLGEFLKSKKPNAKVAILEEDDDLGVDYVDGFKDAIAGSDIEIVAKEKYSVNSASVDPQVTKLAKSGADTFFCIAAPRFAAQAIKRKTDLGWDPLQINAEQG